MPVRNDPHMCRRYRALLCAVAVAVSWTAAIDGLRAQQPSADVLLVGGLVHDGSGEPPVRQDIAVTGDRISFVGDASAAGVDAAEVVDVGGLMVTPGFIDMHSHAELTEDYGRDALPFLHQGVTTVAIGLDGGGTPDVAGLFAGLEGRIGVNAFTYVGHGEIRERVMGVDDRAPTPVELDEMRALVRRAMDEGAFGLSTGLFYVPGYYATTEEVIELARGRGRVRRHLRYSRSRPRGQLPGCRLSRLDTRGDPDRRRGRAARHLQPLQRAGRAQLRPRPRGGPPHRGGARAGRGGGGGAARLHRDPVEPRRLRDPALGLERRPRRDARAVPRPRDRPPARCRDDGDAGHSRGRREAAVRRPAARAERPDPCRRGGRVGPAGARGGAAHPRRRQRGGDEPRPLRHREHPLPGPAAVDDDLHRRPHPVSRPDTSPTRASSGPSRASSASSCSTSRSSPCRSPSAA